MCTFYLILWFVASNSLGGECFPRGIDKVNMPATGQSPGPPYGQATVTHLSINATKYSKYLDLKEKQQILGDSLNKQQISKPVTLNYLPYGKAKNEISNVTGISVSNTSNVASPISMDLLGNTKTIFSSEDKQRDALESIKASESNQTLQSVTSGGETRKMEFKDKLRGSLPKGYSYTLQKHFLFTNVTSRLKKIPINSDAWILPNYKRSEREKVSNIKYTNILLDQDSSYNNSIEAVCNALQLNETDVLIEIQSLLYDVYKTEVFGEYIRTSENTKGLPETQENINLANINFKINEGIKLSLNYETHNLDKKCETQLQGRNFNIKRLRESASKNTSQVKIIGDSTIQINNRIKEVQHMDSVTEVPGTFSVIKPNTVVSSSSEKSSNEVRDKDRLVTGVYNTTTDSVVEFTVRDLQGNETDRLIAGHHYIGKLSLYSLYLFLSFLPIEYSRRIGRTSVNARPFITCM